MGGFTLTKTPYINSTPNILVYILLQYYINIYIYRVSLYIYIYEK